MTKWNTEKIAEALLSRQGLGLPLNFNAIEKTDPRLARAIRQHFGTHDPALRAAGIDPGLVRLFNRRWDKESVAAALRQRQARGLSMNYKAVRQSDQALGSAIRAWFGSHDAALLAAGIDPASVRLLRPVLTKEQVIAALRERRDRSLPLHVAAMRVADHTLERAMRRLFGSHDAALRAAGVDPASVRINGPPWDRGRVVADLRMRHAQGKPMNASSVQESDSALSNAILAQFHCHDAALRAAGADPDSVRRRRPLMKKEEIIAALHERRDRSLALHVRGIRSSDPRLGVSMRIGFGSHDAGLRAAGIDPASVRKRFPMTAEEIIAGLRGLARDGAVADKWVGDVSDRLRKQARARFGSLKAAVNAAGLKYVRLSDATAGHGGHWTDDTVLQSLRDLHKGGHDLRYRHMKTQSQPLFFAAKKLFGSYVNAVKQAGIDYWEMSQAQLAKERAAARLSAKDGAE